MMRPNPLIPLAVAAVVLLGSIVPAPAASAAQARKRSTRRARATRPPRPKPKPTPRAPLKTAGEYVRRGLTAFGKKQYGPAIADFTAAVRLDREYADA